MPNKIKLDFWINNSERDEIYTVDTELAWVWHEGDTLRAGPGPLFGNDDPKGFLVARMSEGLWRLTIDNNRFFTDFDVQAATN